MASNFNLTNEFLDTLIEAIENDESVTVHKLIDALHPVDIADIYHELSIDQARYIHLLLDSEKAADVLMELEEDVREQFLETLPGHVIAHQFIETRFGRCCRCAERTFGCQENGNSTKHRRC